MENVGTYALIDFMPMEPEVYLRLFARQNEAVWPSQFITLGLGVILFWLSWRGRGHGRIAGTLLGVCWVWVGVTFHLNLLLELNWVARYTGWAFVAQGALLALFGFHGRLDRDLKKTAHGVAAVALGFGVFAMACYPLIAPLSGRAWSAIELFGTAPDPTAIATLGLLLLPRRTPWLLAIIPLFWCVYSGATWWAMGWHPGLAVPAAALVFVIAAVRKALRRRKNRSR